MKYEPELDPYFSVDPDFPTDEGPAWGIACRICDQVWKYPKDVEADASEPDDLFLDQGSRNALLAHARSHRAPKLTRVNPRRLKT